MYAASRGSGESAGPRTTSVPEAKLLSASDYDGRTPLHLAAAEGHEIAKYMLQTVKVEANPKDRWGNTPQHEASKLDASKANVKALFER